MSRRSNGLAGIWAEAQRQQQRQREAQHRARVQQQREYERQQRAQEREAARMRREQQAAYRQHREADARRRTEELEARVAALQGLLAAGCRAPAFRTSALLRPEEIEPFSPGRLAHPVPLPDPNAYLPAQHGRLFGANRRAQAQQEAQARYERDRQAAQAAEAQRQRQLAAYRQQYDRWAEARLAEIRTHNAGVGELTASLGAGEPAAVVEYFSAALYASTAWPEELPRQLTAAYDPAARELVVDWELPPYDVVPEHKLVRYLPGSDRDKETPRPVTQRRALYRDVLAQCVLLVLRELFAADEAGVLESVALNGFVDDHDPATGRRARVVLATVMTTRAVFGDLHLEQVNPVDCLVDGLRGQLSARPDQRTAVRPGRRPGDVGEGVVTHGGDEEPDLHEMDPVAFEALVAELFRAMGMQAVTTRRTHDGGVDVAAVDPAPIRGGSIVVQVKRYRNTVPPSAVRDLYGTVQDAGANKGVLVTTSRFGPGSHTFANGKPLELVSGAELLDLLHRHGLRGRLGAGGASASGGPGVPGPRAAGDADATADADAAGGRSGAAAQPGGGGDPDPDAGTDHNVLGMSWAGSVALDTCALVCAGQRVLGDDWFVFFNNERTPDGSVRTVACSPPDKAAMRVAFDALPARADRLVLIAAVDPVAGPEADLSGFTDAGIRLLDPSGAELDRLEVSDGRAGETALVLGSFRRRANGDWHFVIGGKGYTGGLEALVQEYGIEVA
ncbi:restriction endonuclease [Streptomyces sp. JJ36]|uniref:restriction endonuclease n=1 Tax=Streptomyces sp. JJ36 TaxID=2736645 RepID=UPI001EFFBCE2|nr:restriction endonuclease [Streptomyces sp. JJ36]MCF6525270.1 restriction endonuclease [Streptomyces sp. JJ36]